MKVKYEIEYHTFLKLFVIKGARKTIYSLYILSVCFKPLTLSKASDLKNGTPKLITLSTACKLSESKTTFC